VHSFNVLMSVSFNPMKYFKEEIQQGKWGQSQWKLSFIAEEKFSCCGSQSKVANGISPTDSFPFGSFSNFCCLFKHWISLCQMSLLFLGLFLTLRGIETPVRQKSSRAMWVAGGQGEHTGLWGLLVSYWLEQHLCHGDSGWGQEWVKCNPSAGDQAAYTWRIDVQRASLVELQWLIILAVTSSDDSHFPLPLRRCPGSLQAVGCQRPPPPSWKPQVKGPCGDSVVATSMVLLCWQKALGLWVEDAIWNREVIGPWEGEVWRTELGSGCHM
jgi:hypothetical protein